MVLTWFGGRCVLLEERMRGEAPRSILFFPKTKTSRARTLEEKANVIVTTRHEPLPSVSAYTIVMAGEYDIAGFSIRGVAVGSREELAYVVESSGLTFSLFCGREGKLDDRTVDALGVITILAFPVPLREPPAHPTQGIGELVHTIEPKIVLPLVSDAKLRAAVRRELGSEGEVVEKLSVTARDVPPEGFRTIFLEAQ